MKFSDRVFDWAAGCIALAVVIFVVELAVYAALAWLHLRFTISLGACP